MPAAPSIPATCKAFRLQNSGHGLQTSASQSERGSRLRNHHNRCAGNPHDGSQLPAGESGFVQDPAASRGGLHRRVAGCTERSVAPSFVQASRIASTSACILGSLSQLDPSCPSPGTMPSRTINEPPGALPSAGPAVACPLSTFWWVNRDKHTAPRRVRLGPCTCRPSFPRFLRRRTGIVGCVAFWRARAARPEQKSRDGSAKRLKSLTRAVHFCCRYPREARPCSRAAGDRSLRCGDPGGRRDRTLLRPYGAVDTRGSSGELRRTFPSAGKCVAG